MRASIAVAILSLAAGITPSVALPLPAIKSRGGTISRPPTSKPLTSKPLPPLPAEHAPSSSNAGSPPKSEGGSITELASPNSPRPQGNFSPFAPSDSRPSSEHPPSSSGSTPQSADPASAKPKPLNAPLKSAISEVFKSAVSTGIATGIIASSDAIGQPQSRRELLERFDEQIKLAARAYLRELLTAPMDDLD